MQLERHNAAQPKGGRQQARRTCAIRHSVDASGHEEAPAAAVYQKLPA